MSDINWSKIPRISLGIFPTPLHELPNAGRMLGAGRRLFIKRDDLTGVALGGNKVRKLEFVLAEAKKQGCDTIITTGGAQSNHAAITAACCNKLGLKAILVLLGQGVRERKGNLLLNHLQGAQVRFVESDNIEDVYPVMDALAAELQNAGQKPFIVPLGASTPLGTLGYVLAMQELFAQARELGLFFDHVVCTIGSGGTYAGALLGARLFSPSTRITGIAISEGLSNAGFICQLARDAAALLGQDIAFDERELEIRHYFGQGYAIPSPQGNAAIRSMAAWEGLFLDPVYTGKTFGGLLNLHKQGYFKPNSNILFLHTGGAATLFSLPLE